MESRLIFKVSELLDALEETTGEPGDLTSTLQHIAQTAQTFFAADSCVIFAINPITGRFIASLTVAGNLLRGDKVSYKEPSLGGLARQVLMQRILVVEDLEDRPEYQSTVTHAENIRSFVALALYINDHRQPLGVLYLNFRQPQQFNPGDYKLLQIFADQASFILQETWLLHRYQAVARIGQEINHELATIDNLFQKLQKHIADILDTGYALLLAIYQPQSNTLDLYLEEEGHTIFRENDLLEGACQYVIETQQTLFIRQMSEEAEHQPFKHIKIITGKGAKESLIFVPLVLRDVPLGVLSIQHPQPNAYNQEDLYILQLLANHIALALYNMRLYDNLSRLNETGQLLTQQLHSDQTLQATVDQIREVTQADVVILYPYEPGQQHFELPPRIAGRLLDPTSQQNMAPNLPNDIVKLVLHHVEPIFAKESALLYKELPQNVRVKQGNFQERENIRSMATLPLHVGDESVGVLFINFRQSQRFDATQKLFMEGLAHYAAIAIKNAQEYDSLIRRRVRELEILQDIDRELSRTLELKPILSTLLRLAYEQVPAEEAGILLYNTRKQALEIPAAIGPHAETRQKIIVPLQEAKGITLWVLEHKKPARVDNVHHDPQWRDLYIQSVAATVSELDVPLLDGEEVVGILNFESTREGAFRQEDEHFLLTLAGQAVLAIKNAQAYEREKRLAEEGRVLNQVSKEITSQLDPTHIFDLILEKALELTHSAWGTLHLYDPDWNDLWMAAERGVAREKRNQRISLDEGVVGYVARNKQFLNVDTSQPYWSEIYLDLIPGTRSELAVPLLAGNELRGVLNIESPTPNNFSESDVRLLMGLADMAVIALQNVQAYERETRLVAEGRVLNEISKEITSQLDPTHIFDLILEKALDLTHSALGTLWLYDDDQNNLQMVSEHGVIEQKKGRRVRLDEGIVGYVARNKQLLIIDPSEVPWNDIYMAFIPGASSELTVPMLAGDELRGVLNIESPTPNNFSERDVRLMKGLADLAVVALQNAERYQQAETEAQRFKLLYQASQELGKITDLIQLEQAYELVVQIAARQSQSQAVIYLYNEVNEEVVLKCAMPYRQAPLFDCIKLDEGLNGQVARERRTIVIHDSDNLPPHVASIKQSDLRMHSLIVTPIMFKDVYYGNLGLRHEDVGHFRDTDTLFFEGLAQQLASTIYRLETAQERQEFKKRAISAEVMSSMGQIAFELTHRWGNDLGLVRSYVNDIRSELKTLHVTSTFVSEKLDNIIRAVRAVLDLSKELKEVLLKSGEIIAGEPATTYSRRIAGELVVLQPSILLEEAQNVSSLPANISICLQIDEDVAAVRVMHSAVADILRNLVTNAIDAMPEGGKITLSARNCGRSVALEVTDIGVGIPQQSQTKIFDLFYSTKGSSGFGLWSARTNALKNHGDLLVRSEEGKGTTFTLLLPRVEEETS